MKTLYESILDTDFNINDDVVVCGALREILQINKGIDVSFDSNEEKFIVTSDKGNVIIDGSKFADVMSQATSKKIIFKAPTSSRCIVRFICGKPNTVWEGLDVSSETIILRPNVISGRLILKDCFIRAAEDLNLFGTGTIQLKNTLCWATACDIQNCCDVKLDARSQINLNYEMTIKDLSKTQVKWLEKQNLIGWANGHGDPKINTNPHDMLGAKHVITDYFVIRHNEYVYNFYKGFPDHFDDDIRAYILSNGWTIILRWR